MGLAHKIDPLKSDLASNATKVVVLKLFGRDWATVLLEEEQW